MFLLNFVPLLWMLSLSPIGFLLPEWDTQTPSQLNSSGIWGAAPKSKAGAVDATSGWLGVTTKQQGKAWKLEALEHPHPGSANAREAGRIMGPFIPPGGKCQKTLKWEKNCPFVLQMVIIVRKFIHPLGIHSASSKRGFTKVTSYLPTVILLNNFFTGRKVELPRLRDALSLLCRGAKAHPRESLLLFRSDLSHCEMLQELP